MKDKQRKKMREDISRLNDEELASARESLLDLLDQVPGVPIHAEWLSAVMREQQFRAKHREFLLNDLDSPMGL